ncbi:hypothetical protein MM239_20145 [Belliella sp. DSM 111904]|uniref:Uncharacterized protein n=1 Tax=Belliella filtrata TaxID=2923435 RepID=A0ABS9V5L5_9BACT|nr:hypothetical protein [Belliella filtrata]MCH7411709.1 hypothetical protein [Belliella filtrata]
MKWKFLLILVIIEIKSFAQDITLTTHDSIEEGLFFDKVIIYNYSDQSGKSSQIWVYLNTCNHRMLFDHSSWGKEDEMIHYIIAQQDGSYLTFGTAAEGSKNRKTATVDSIYLETIEPNIDFPRSDEYLNFSPISSMLSGRFGLKTKTYQVEKRMDINAQESMTIARVSFDTRLLYGFNEISTDLQLPNLLGGSHPYLHPNDLIINYHASYEGTNGKKYWIQLDLIAFEHTTYWAPIEDIVLRKKSDQRNIIVSQLSDVIELTSDCYE